MEAVAIHQRRIRRLGRHFRGVTPGQAVTIGLPVTPDMEARLRLIGFDQLADGETVLPRVVGSVSRYNAEGKEIVHRDRPKETVYRTVEWTRTEFHGKDEQEVTDFVERPYQRYPRTPVLPPGVELTSTRTPDGHRIIVSSALVYAEESDELLHTVNLFLELFREAHVLGEELRPVTLPPLKRLGWHILPPGERLWPQLREELAPLVQQAKKGQRQFLEYRLQTIAKYGPMFTAIGTAGFIGYVIFGFPKQDLYILESAYYGNATYVLREDWARLSQLTKAELVHGELHDLRLVHRANWAEDIRSLFD